MLALDSTIGCIEASEPDVLDMYRSAPLTTALVTDSEPASCEAFVCAIRKKARVQVYVALVADDKRIFVYTTSGQPEAEREYHHTLQEALSFARSMGFVPERMDLNYSPAMREVVVRGIKILRPPGNKMPDLLKHGPAHAPGTDGDKKSAQARQMAAPGFRDLKDPRLTTETDTVCQLKEELATLSTAKDALSAKLQQVSAQHLAGAAELASRAEDRSRLDSEKKALALRLEAAEAKSADLAALRRELDAITGQRDEASRLKDAEAAEHAKTTEALSRAHREIANLITERDAAKLRAEQVTAEIGNACAERETLRGQIAMLSTQREAALLHAGRFELQGSSKSAEVSTLRGELAALSAQREAALLRAENAENLAGKSSASAAEVEALRGELAALSAQREAVSLRAENAENLAGENSARAVEVEAPRGDPAPLTVQSETGQDQERAAGAPGTRLQPAKAPAPVAVERCAPASAGNRDASASPEAPAADASWQPDPAPFEARQTADESEWYQAAPAKLPAGREFCAADDDFFPAAEDADGSPGRFLLKAGLYAIEYASPDQVLQLHQSINLAQISPDGKVPVSCQGYVCCLKTAAGAPQVFVAIFGTQSGQTWIYHPELQPEDQHGYANAIKGAIAFAEGVGFVMESVQLGADRRPHDEAVLRCQVLRRTA